MVYVIIAKHLCSEMRSEGRLQPPTATELPFKPEFTIVIFIHYKPRIAVVILDL